MTINEMIEEMKETHKAISEIALEIKYKQPEKSVILSRALGYSNEWAFYLTQRVITNYKKAQITMWYKESKVALRHAKRIQAA